MSKRVKITSRNKDEYEIIPPEKVAESAKRIKKAMKKFIRNNFKQMEPTFEEYLNKLREDVKREPTTDVERGFRTAVVVIYEQYKKLSK